ncbi:hypothetical protein [Streptomyces sp. NPDC046909]|uniref:hypothetical protein n=1 Tax=Streptomyces sp. NPDC046909 TaxID=3155617 RepID=UPI0033D06682
MATRISVSVKGLTGLDDPDRMLAELESETGLSWRPEPVDEGRVLSGGIVEIILVAVAVKGAEMTLEATVAAVKRVVERWRRERLEPPEATVDTEPVPDPPPTPDTQRGD